MGYFVPHESWREVFLHTWGQKTSSSEYHMRRNDFTVEGMSLAEQRQLLNVQFIKQACRTDTCKHDRKNLFCISETCYLGAPRECLEVWAATSTYHSSPVYSCAHDAVRNSEESSGFDDSDDGCSSFFLSVCGNNGIRAAGRGLMCWSRTTLLRPRGNVRLVVTHWSRHFDDLQ